MLAIVAPYCGKPPVFHLNRRGDVVMIAPDRIVDFLLAQGHQVVYCNAVGEVCDKPACCSGLPIHTESDIRDWHFDVVWHCVKDPTPPDLIEPIQRLTAKVPAKVPIINDVSFLRHWTKPYYYAGLREKEVPTPVIHPDSTPTKVQPGQRPTFLQLSDRNNDRETGKPVVVEFIDNVSDDLRTFFRVPYATGRVLPGTRYFVPRDQFIAKTGMAVRREPYVMPLQTAMKVAAALGERGVGVAHLEGFSKPDDAVRAIFDVNPFPCSDGVTFDPMSMLIAQRFVHVYNL
jgi:hypothetical protein